MTYQPESTISRTFMQGVAPTSAVPPEEGEIWIDTANDNMLKRWDGKTWVNVVLGPKALSNVPIQP